MARWINKEDRDWGKPPWAYMIDRPFPCHLGGKTNWHFTTIYNCYGICQGGLMSWRCVNKTPTGLDIFTIKGWGAPNIHDFKGYNVIKDIRTIEMIAGGCCPPELLMEFLGTEGIPD